MSSISNIPINARSMNGVITISDGTAVLENGSLTNVDNVDTNNITAQTLNTQSFSSNDFVVNTNVDLSSDTSKIQFTFGIPANNTNITRSNINTPSLNSGLTSLTGNLNMNSNNINNVNNINVSTINGSAPGGFQNLSSVLTQGNVANTSINMNNNNITNGGTITGTTITGTSASLTGNLNMNNNNISNCNNLQVSTINGATPGGLQNLSSVLTQGNTANTLINMNSNNITNINELKISKTTTGVGNPSMLIECNNTDAFPENFVINRYSITPAIGDQLFAMFVQGRDSLLNSVEYTRINNEILDPLSTAPKGQMRFYCRGGTNTMSTYEILQLQDSEIDALRLLNMNNNNITNVNTLTGVSNVINVNSNTINNINQLSVIKTTTGILNPAILLQTTNTNTEPINMFVRRIKPSPFGATSDQLFVINVEGTDNVGGQIEYTRQETVIANPSSATPIADVRFFTRNGTGPMGSMETLRINGNLSFFNSGLRTGEVNLNVTANTTIPDKAIGSIAYISNSNASYTIGLPPLGPGNGAYFYLYNLSPNQHTLSHSNNIGGAFGTGTTTMNINTSQGYLFTLQSSGWRCINVFGVPYQYCRYHTATQSVTNVNQVGLFNSVCNSIDLNTNAWSVDTWNGERLTYNAGTFTNNTGDTMTLHIQAKIFANPNSTARYGGVLKLATRYQDGTSPNWYQLGTGGTTVMPISDIFTLKNGEAFQIVYQASATSTFGSTTSVNHNRIIITRLS